MPRNDSSTEPGPPVCSRPELPAQTAHPTPDPSPILLAAKRNVEEVRAILVCLRPAAISIKRTATSRRWQATRIQRLQLADILPMLMESISRTADPDQALNHWERMLASASRSSLLDYLRRSPRMLDLLCVIFGNSDSLAFTLIRDPMLVYWLAEEDVLSRSPTRKGKRDGERTSQSIGHLTSKELKLDVLRRFRRREMLRIGVRDLLRLADGPEKRPARCRIWPAILIQAAYEIVDTDLKTAIWYADASNRQGRWVETRFTVIGMGKLGGHELNYSSDVDLIYVYESHEGETRAPRGGRAAIPAGVACPTKNILRFSPAN